MFMLSAGFNPLYLKQYFSQEATSIKQRILALGFRSGHEAGPAPGARAIGHDPAADPEPAQHAAREGKEAGSQ